MSVKLTRSIASSNLSPLSNFSVFGHYRASVAKVRERVHYHMSRARQGSSHLEELVAQSVLVHVRWFAPLRRFEHCGIAQRQLLHREIYVLRDRSAVSAAVLGRSMHTRSTIGTSGNEPLTVNQHRIATPFMARGVRYVY